MYRTMYAELRQRISGDDFASAFDTRGRFVKVMVKGRKYWYFDRPGPGGRQKRKYVGPDSDETIRSCVERFAELKANARQRRNLITTLKRQARLAGPDPSTGDIIEAIAAAGLFHRRGVLIGAAAYRCYPAYLGIELPFLLMETANVDFVQFHSISTDVQNQTAALGNVLRELDPTFRDITNEIDGSPNKVFGNKRGKKVESPLQSASSADDLEKTVKAITHDDDRRTGDVR